MSSSIKAATQSKYLEEKGQTERQRDVLVLILSHLQTNGYIETATTLLRETRSVDSLAKYKVADNIDLSQVLKEYDESYRLKFGRRPIFCRENNTTNMQNITSDESSKKHPRSAKRRLTRDRGTGHTTLPPLSINQGTPTTTKPLQSRKRALDEETSTPSLLVTTPNLTVNGDQSSMALQDLEPTRTQSLKPLPSFDGDQELRSLALSIRRDIVEECATTQWSDIVGLDDAKRVLKEAILLPRKYPQLFTGLRSPWKSILLYGCPGTGKTLLAKAVASESDSTFFNISASSLVSKYRGDSEKLIRMLFTLARHYSPSTIFIDEVDSIMNHRGGVNGSCSASEGSEHESSRRMKTELLVQMDGLLANNSDVFVLAATNLPWSLDSAFLRRCEKRIMIPLPDQESRKNMIQSHLSEFSPSFSKAEVLDNSASLLGGYTGSDIKSLCKEVAMKPLRRMLQHLEVMDGVSDSEISLMMKRNPVKIQDFNDAVSTVAHSTSADLCERHQKWSISHGST